MDNEYIEAADILEQIALKLRDEPREIVIMASSDKLWRDAQAKYMLSLANSLRKQAANESQDGSG